ncbi:MAG: SDR family NAD(P)-dependent oxidoreductase [Persicimonas sp.]
MKTLQGRNAIVTGASRGLGVHIARTLARKQVNLALAARSVDELDKVQREMASLGVEAVAIPTDLTDTDQIAALAEKAEHRLGPVDLLVNNAGVELLSPYRDYPLEMLETIVQVNLLAPMLLTRELLPGMLDRGRGHILNMASLAGKIGLPHQTPYAATKASVIMFTHSLRAELLDEPVGASVICPGFVDDSGMYARLDQGEHVKSGAPLALKPTTAAKVSAAVIKAIERDTPEVVVNALPMRPVTVLREFFPRLTARMHQLLGVTEYTRRLSAQLAQERKP